MGFQPSWRLKFEFKKIQKKIRKVSCAPMLPCQHGPMCRISAHYNEVCHGYCPLSWHLPLKYLDLHSWSPLLEVLSYDHIILNFYTFSSQTIGHQGSKSERISIFQAFYIYFEFFQYGVKFLQSWLFVCRGWIIEKFRWLCNVIPAWVSQNIFPQW